MKFATIWQSTKQKFSKDARVELQDKTNESRHDNLYEAKAFRWKLANNIVSKHFCSFERQSLTRNVASNTAFRLRCRLGHGIAVAREIFRRPENLPDHSEDPPCPFFGERKSNSAAESPSFSSPSIRQADWQTLKICYSFRWRSENARS